MHIIHALSIQVVSTAIKNALSTGGIHHYYLLKRPFELCWYFLHILPLFHTQYIAIYRDMKKGTINV